jgi:hypothetical protein
VRVLRALALLAPALAGCLGGSGPSAVSPADAAASLPAPIEAITDPAGDATEYNTELLGTAAYKCRAAGGLAWGACGKAVGTGLGAVPRATGGVPGPPELDVLGSTFQETPEHLEVRIQVARLDEAFLRSDPDDPAASWAACWTLAEVPECAYLVTGLYSAYDRYTDACNPYFWCSWRIAHEVEFGEPATIRLFVPRALVDGGNAGGLLEGPTLTALTEPPVTTLGPAGLSSWELSGPVAASGRTDNAHDEYAADVSEPGSDVPLVLQASPRMAEEGPFGFEDPADAPAERPDADIRRVEVVETGVQVTLAARLAHVRDEPGNLEAGFAWGLREGFVLEAFVHGEDGHWVVTTRRCASDGCSHPLRAQLTVVPGAPGWVNLTLERVDVGSPHKGDLTTLLLAWSVFGETRIERAAGPLGFRATQGGTQSDFAGVAPAHWFGMDTEGPAIRPAPAAVGFTGVETYRH